MLFCPFCGVFLVLRNTSGRSEYQCQTCPFVHAVLSTTVLDRNISGMNKTVPEGGVEEGASQNLGGQRLTITCVDLCGSNLAYYVQEQLRSADEPPTTFYKCCQCGAQWRSD